MPTVDTRPPKGLEWSLRGNRSTEMPTNFSTPWASGNLLLHHRPYQGTRPGLALLSGRPSSFYTLPLKHNIPALLYVTPLDTYSSVKDIKVAEEPMFVEPWNRPVKLRPRERGTLSSPSSTQRTEWMGYSPAVAAAASFSTDFSNQF